MASSTRASMLSSISLYVLYADGLKNLHTLSRQISFPSAGELRLAMKFIVLSMQNMDSGLLPT